MTLLDNSNALIDSTTERGVISSPIPLNLGLNAFENHCHICDHSNIYFMNTIFVSTISLCALMDRLPRMFLSNSRRPFRSQINIQDFIISRDLESCADE